MKILNAIGGQQAVLLVLLDLSAAFDTVSHAKLISTLQRLGITGRAVQWFISYRTDGAQYIQIGLSKSSYERIQVWRAARVGPRADPVHNLHHVTGQRIPLSQHELPITVLR